MHCGLDLDFHAAPEATASPGSRLVCVGRLCEEKGQLLLVEAVRRLATMGKNVEVVLAGDGEMRAEIEALIDRHDLGKKVRIIGWVTNTQVRDEILAARALVLPSFAEGLPVVIMEAMALGRPVISTFIGGIPELVQAGQNGWLVPAGDVEALTEAMQDCLETPTDVLTRMGKAGRARVQAHHDINIEAGKLVKLFAAACQDVSAR